MTQDSTRGGRVTWRHFQDVHIRTADTSPFDLDKHLIGLLDLRHGDLSDC